MKKRRKMRRKQRGRLLRSVGWLLPFALLIAFWADYRMPIMDAFPEAIEEGDAGFDLLPEGNNAGPELDSTPEMEAMEDSAPLVDLTGLTSPYALLMERESGKVVAEENSKIKLYPASLTKIMTVILAIELEEDLDRQITMEERYFERLYELDATVAGFQVGETVPFRDLLYGATLPSGADACLAIAYLLAGSEPAYVELMNAKAEELGLKRTHFSNTTGLHDPDNYSSVGDLAQLLQYALQDEDFYQIFTTRAYTTAPTNLNPEGIRMRSSLFRYMDDFPELDPLLLGGKTGFTEEAGLCLASLARVDGTDYILVTAGAGAQVVVPGQPIVEIKDPLHVQDADLVYTQLVR